MSEDKTGGPAFPVDRKYLGDGQYANQPGMTLRDWFAGQALAGAFANPPHGIWDEKIIVNRAYAIADAMLAKRAKETAHVG